MELTLNQLRFFREVARQGQFTRAAEALYVSQPAVSKGVKDLERQIGMPLLEQVGRQVRLTDAGEILHGHCERIFAELADARRALLGLQAGDSGRLVVGASSTPGTYLLPELLGTFQRRYPRVELVLEIADTNAVLDRVVGGRLDLGIVGEMPFDPGLRVDLFRTETLVLIVAPGHPLTHRKRISVEDLATKPFVLRERGSSTREVLERTLRGKGIEPRVVMELGSTEAIKRTVAAGLALSLVSEHAVELEERAGALAVRRIAELDPTRGIYIVRRRTLHLSRLHERFLEALTRDADVGGAVYS